MIRSAAPILTLLLIAGCATDGRYPSLAPRAAEKQGFGEPVVAHAVAAPDPGLDARLAAQGADLDRIATGFTGAAQNVRRSVSGAARPSVGSERWLDAQAALTRVDDWRAQASALATDIEAAASARAAALLPPYPALDALRDRAAAETGREAATVQELQASVPAA